MKNDKRYIICKFQRPLFDSRGEVNQVLIYNESRNFTLQVEMDEGDMKEIFPNDELKTYWACVLDEDNLHPIEQLEEQDW